MRRKGFDGQFDAIVDFAGIEQLMDTLVKGYGSGMYARLAVAVARHLSGDVWIVDEVVLDGDGEGQQRCVAVAVDAASEDDRSALRCGAVGDQHGRERGAIRLAAYGVLDWGRRRDRGGTSLQPAVAAAWVVPHGFLRVQHVGDRGSV